jgi:hypothetical protein
MKQLLLAALAFFALVPTALADECRGNQFQPTFVHHDKNKPHAWYVEANGAFTLMPDPGAAQVACRARGVRQSINGQTCAQRSWGDFGCGCNITPSPNATCARFQSHLKSKKLIP